MLSSALLLTFVILGMICWGSWHITKKGCGEWRYESFYLWYIIGVFIFTSIFGLLFYGLIEGWNIDKFLSSFSVHSWVYLSVILAGVLWNIGNIFLVASLTLAGYAVSWPIGVGVGLLLGTVLAYSTYPEATAHPYFLFFGLTLILVALLINAYCYREREIKLKKAFLYFKKGVIYAILAGLCIGVYLIPFNFAIKEGLSPSATAILLTFGGLVSSVIILPILIKKPLVPLGKPISFKDWLKGEKKWYLLALLGGLIWSLGLIFSLTAAFYPILSVAIVFTIVRCNPLVSALWGLFVWKEFQGMSKKVYILLGTMFILYLLGIIIVGNAKA